MTPLHTTGIWTQWRGAWDRKCAEWMTRRAWSEEDGLVEHPAYTREFDQQETITTIIGTMERKPGLDHVQHNAIGVGRMDV